MSHAIRMKQNGGPEVLKWESWEPGAPSAGEALVRHKAIGLNFIDIYHRTGLYPLPELPATPGMEAAGVVEQVGDGVEEVSVGDRVAYAGLPVGAYCEVRRIPADRLVKLPDTIDFETAAAMMLKGMTARYLLFGCFPVAAGDTILIHAAAGGVGLIVSQWATHLGATVIGTVGTREKAELARANGCRYPILYNEEDFVTQVQAITKGRGVDVVYDSVGRATFSQSLHCLRPMGLMVSFGQSSGSVPPVDLGDLSAGGSLFLTRPSLITYTARRKDLLAHAADLFDVVGSGVVKISVNQRFPLAETARAHRILETRKTTGSTLLIP